MSIKLINVEKHKDGTEPEFKREFN